MRFFAVSLLAATALAAPAPTKFPWNALTNFIPKNFPQALASSCSVSGLSPPAAPTPLPAPPAGSTLGLVAIGKGTQNYTCADSSSTTLPVAAGALATLYNASCLAASFPSVMNEVTQIAYSMPDSDLRMLQTVGEHYFADATTPTFAINAYGTNPMGKNATSPPPSDPTVNVAWLYLTPKATTNKIVAVYRVDTNNGMQPATCDGVTPGLFTVPYTAQYWIYISQ